MYDSRTYSGHLENEGRTYAGVSKLLAEAANSSEVRVVQRYMPLFSTLGQGPPYRQNLPGENTEVSKCGRTLRTAMMVPATLTTVKNLTKYKIPRGECMVLELWLTSIYCCTCQACCHLQDNTFLVVLVTVGNLLRRAFPQSTSRGTSYSSMFRHR